MSSQLLGVLTSHFELLEFNTPSPPSSFALTDTSLRLSFYIFNSLPPFLLFILPSFFLLPSPSLFPPLLKKRKKQQPTRQGRNLWLYLYLLYVPIYVRFTGSSYVRGLFRLPWHVLLRDSAPENILCKF